MSRSIVIHTLTTWLLVSTYICAQQRLDQKNSLNTADIAILENKTWRDLQTYQVQYDRVVERVRSHREGVNGYAAQEIRTLISRASGGDLLTQSVGKGVISGDVVNTRLVLQLFDRIAAASDPLDLPARSRLWNKKTTMLVGLGRILWRLANNAEIPITDMQLIEADPQRWRIGFAPTIPVFSPSTSAPDSSNLDNPAEQTASPSDSLLQTTPIPKLPPSLQSQAPKKLPEPKPITTTPSEAPTSSTPWSIIVVLIVAGCGVLWLLVKRRK